MTRRALASIHTPLPSRGSSQPPLRPSQLSCPFKAKVDHIGRPKKSGGRTNADSLPVRLESRHTLVCAHVREVEAQRTRAGRDFLLGHYSSILWPSLVKRRFARQEVYSIGRGDQGFKEVHQPPKCHASTGCTTHHGICLRPISPRQ